MDLYLIRHGESTGNIVDYDVPDGVLTPKGEEQARRTAQAFKGVKLTNIISSPLQRALQTAVPIAHDHDLRITVWKRTHECRGGGLHVGPSLKDLQEWFPRADFPDDLEPEGWIYDGPEPANVGLERAHHVVTRLKQEFNDDANIAVVSHGGFIQMMLRAFLGLPDPRGVRFGHDNASINHLKISEDRVTLVKVNDISHLDDDVKDLAI